jgi:hypothetical protein
MSKIFNEINSRIIELSKEDKYNEIGLLCNNLFGYTITDYIESMPLVKRVDIPKEENPKYSFYENYIIRMVNNLPEFLKEQEKYSTRQQEQLKLYGQNSENTEDYKKRLNE